MTALLNVFDRIGVSGHEIWNDCGRDGSGRWVSDCVRDGVNEHGIWSAPLFSAA